MFGVRVGGSGDRGFEIGLNAAVGVEVNGSGTFAGARADVGIRDGVNASAGARATGGDRRAGAAAYAQAHIGNATARAGGTNSGIVEEAERKRDLANVSVNEATSALRREETNLRAINSAHDDLENQVATTREQQESAARAKARYGRKKTEALQRKTDTQILCGERRTQLADIQRRQAMQQRLTDRAAGGSSAVNFSQMQKALVRTTDVPIEELEATITEHDRDIAEYTKKEQRAEALMLDRASKVSKLEIAFRDLSKKQADAAAEVVRWRSLVASRKEELKKLEAECKAASRKAADERETLNFVEKRA